MAKQRPSEDDASMASGSNQVASKVQRPFQTSEASSNTSMTCSDEVTSGETSGESLRQTPVAARHSHFSSLGEHYGTEAPTYDESTHPVRATVDRLTESAGYKSFICVVVLVNWLAMIVETDMRSKQRSAYWDTYGDVNGFSFEVPWEVQMSNMFCQAIFFADITLRLFVARLMFFRLASNLFDAAVLAADIALIFTDQIQELPPVACLRVIRVLRVIRFFRTSSAFRELYLMMEGFRAALRAIAFAVMMIACFLILWSVFAVEFVNIDNMAMFSKGTYGDCPENVCKEAFSSVWFASMTLLKTIIAGDSWGQMSYPLVTKQPRHAFVLLGSLLMIQIGLMNLIVAVMVDRATEARLRDDALQLAQKKDNYQIACSKLKMLFSKMDKDGSGTVSLTELRKAYFNFPEFKNMLDTLDVRPWELESMFEIFDQNFNDEVDFEEFVETLHDFRERSVLTLLTFIRHNTDTLVSAVDQMQEQVSKQNAKLSKIRRCFPLLKRSVNKLVLGDSPRSARSRIGPWPDSVSEGSSLSQASQKVKCKSDRLDSWGSLGTLANDEEWDSSVQPRITTLPANRPLATTRTCNWNVDALLQNCVREYVHEAYQSWDRQQTCPSSPGVQHPEPGAQAVKPLPRSTLRDEDILPIRDYPPLAPPAPLSQPGLGVTIQASRLALKPTETDAPGSTIRARAPAFAGLQIAPVANRRLQFDVVGHEQPECPTRSVKGLCGSHGAALPRAGHMSTPSAWRASSN